MKYLSDRAYVRRTCPVSVAQTPAPARAGPLFYPRDTVQLRFTQYTRDEVKKKNTHTRRLLLMYG